MATMTTTATTTPTSTHTHTPTSSHTPTRDERMHTNCEIIWGKGNYELEAEADDWETWWVLVRRDYGSSYGGPLTITEICSSEDSAWAELDRVLAAWAKQVQSGEPMATEDSSDKRLEVFGGAEHKSHIRQLWGELKRRRTHRHSSHSGKGDK
ncbi:hypothetical protein BJY01DRAFT_251639 [Aspergillus pseudoustus]|uniref:Uncharacterized protein n=1 Tax=Aspergillus pseudoustus TaxID=1810923 RepID=A0ABR4JAZ2_9EURO